MHPDGMHIGARKITVSTAGEVAGIRRFAEEPWQVRLSVSLHAADDELRSQLVPLNKRYPLKESRFAPRAAMPVVFDLTASGIPADALRLEGVEIAERGPDGTVFQVTGADPQIILPAVEVPKEHRGDQVAGEDEEHVDPDEASGQPPYARMERHHQVHGHGPNAVEMGSVAPERSFAIRHDRRSYRPEITRT